MRCGREAGGSRCSAPGWRSAARSTPPFELPEERTGGRPLTQAPQPAHRRDQLAPGPPQSTPDGVRFEFTLVNGTPRDYLELDAPRGAARRDREIATVRYPAGPLAAGASRQVRAHLAPPGFAVEEPQLELIWAQE